MIVVLDIAKLMTAGQFNQVMLSVGRLASKRDHKNPTILILLIDPYSLSNYSVVMDSLEQTDQDLQRLEKQLRKLLVQIQKLREENQSLHVRQETLVSERASLVAKNDEARTKVEAMINRLKGLEQT
jgi:cell division protein ZapB